MKSLFDAATAAEIQQRISLVGPGCVRQWGKMSAPQALAHCSIAMEWAVGERVEPRMFVGRILGPLAKSSMLKDDKPMGRNSPTSKSLIVAEERDLEKERQRLSELVDRFCASGPQETAMRVHTFFGPLTQGEWAQLMYKHLDHHLRQFGV